MPKPCCAAPPRPDAVTRNRFATGAVLIGALAAPAAPAAAQTPDCGSSLNGPSRQVVEAEGQRIVFATRPWPVTVGRPFALDLSVCTPMSTAPGSAPPRLLRLDADMPAHRHGMNYRPGVTPLGGGRYRAEGLLFHMPGSWRLRFELDAGAGAAPHQLSKALTIE